MRRRKQLTAAGLAVLVAVAAFVLWPRPDRVTRENFDRVKGGMTRAEVKAILGPPGDYATGPTIENPFGPGEHSGDLTLPSDLMWKTDSMIVRLCFDDAGQVAGLAWNTLHRDEQSPLENLRWRARRLWQRWFH
jgi:hypothetical protein